ncbi:uncharacterized protein A4U43_C04F20660 [Asparagus officinalis]|uniref:Uncharacterized protein n=1 Tax=Asparagus officinalis TaxID=4686 RepID=A0A5P1F562_ASPOF|nr:uncharacterized protein A4U43_C04F20660 [Asparagus officinalis]
MGAFPIDQKVAASQSVAKISSPQAVGEDAAAVPAHEADVVILDNRSRARGEGVEITMTEVEEAEAPIVAEKAGYSSARDSWVSQPKEKESEEVETEVQSTPLPTSIVTAPTCPTLAPGPSIVPSASLPSLTP